MSLTKYIVDFNLRKSWNAVIAKVNPHMVLFLGDMMDNGRSDFGGAAYVTLGYISKKTPNNSNMTATRIIIPGLDQFSDLIRQSPYTTYQEIMT